LPFQFVRLREGKPEAFLLRINAITPGVYTFACEVVLSDKDKQLICPLSQDTTVLFD
jgi:hypothetical protein